MPHQNFALPLDDKHQCVLLPYCQSILYRGHLYLLQNAAPCIGMQKLLDCIASGEYEKYTANVRLMHPSSRWYKNKRIFFSIFMVVRHGRDRFLSPIDKRYKIVYNVHDYTPQDKMWPSFWGKIWRWERPFLAMQRKWRCREMRKRLAVIQCWGDSKNWLSKLPGDVLVHILSSF